MSRIQADAGHIFNILHWIKRIEAVSIKNYEDPEDYKDLLSKNLENIGNSINKISEETKEMFGYSKKDWQEIIGFRNISAHTYEIVNMKEVKNIVEKDIPELKQKTINIVNLLIEKSINNGNSLEFSFNKKIYSVEPIFNNNEKVRIVIDGDSFAPKILLKNDISSTINNIVAGKEIINGISVSSYESLFKEKGIDAAIKQMKDDKVDNSVIRFRYKEIFPFVSRSEVEKAIKKYENEKGMSR